ncbi:MAG: hypothetical protein PHI15_09905 [Methanomicrobium sp.]|nr:hypothetical protein [Methanomicrobium sp.]
MSLKFDIAVPPVLPEIKTNANHRNGDIERVAQEFESYFLFSMFKAMEKTTNIGGKQKETDNPLISAGYEKMADMLSKNGKGIGIKEMIVKNMSNIYKNNTKADYNRED